MKRYVATVIIVTLIASLVLGCAETNEKSIKNVSQTKANAYKVIADAGILQVRMHDAPPEYDVKEVWITIDGIEVHRAAVEQSQEEPASTGTPTPTSTAIPIENPGTPTVIESSGTPVVEPTPDPTQEPPVPTDEPGDEGNAGWITLTMSGTSPIDIIQYQDGLEALLASQELEAGKYTQIRMAISKVEVVYSDGSGTETQTAEAKLPSGKLKFTRPFDINPGGSTILSFDFVADEAINFTGGGQVIMKPVIKLDISYEGGEDGDEPTEEPTPGNDADLVTPGTEGATSGKSSKGSDKPNPDNKPDGKAIGKPDSEEDTTQEE